MNDEFIEVKIKVYREVFPDIYNYLNNLPVKLRAGGVRTIFAEYGLMKIIKLQSIMTSKINGNDVDTVNKVENRPVLYPIEWDCTELYKKFGAPK